MNKKIIVCCAAIFVAFGIFFAAGSAAAAPKDVLKVRVAAQPTSGQVFQFIAEEKGFNKEEGVEVQMVWLSNLSDAASALMAKQVDVLSTYGTGGPLIYIARRPAHLHRQRTGFQYVRRIYDHRRDACLRQAGDPVHGA